MAGDSVDPQTVDPKHIQARRIHIHIRVHMRMNMHIHGMHIRTHLLEFRFYWMEDTRHDAYIMQGFEKGFAFIQPDNPAFAARSRNRLLCHVTENPGLRQRKWNSMRPRTAT